MTADVRIEHPLIRYHGGKFRMADWIVGLMPAHRCYVEPYGGAASVLLRKPRAYAEVYNDLDDAIVNLFRVLRDPVLCPQLVEQLQLTPYSRVEFEAAGVECEDASAVERARATVIRAMMGFGSAGATKGSTGFRVDTRRKHGTAQDIWAKYPPLLASCGRRLVGVMIECRPALDVLQQHDAPDTLHYVDPPYVHSTRARDVERSRYYRHEMTDQDHRELLDVLVGLQGMVLVSGYESALYASHLAGWTLHRRRARIASGRGAGTRVEHLWVNPAASRVLGDAQGLPLRMAS